MSKLKLSLMVLICTLTFSILLQAQVEHTVTPVNYVETSRYMGLWYEIAAIPQHFEKNCSCVTAEYSLVQNKKIKVVNTCRHNGPGGERTSISGTAHVVDEVTNAKLKVNVFKLFSGDYWVIDLDPNYQYAAISSKEGKHLWILSRQPTVDAQVYQGIIARVSRQVDLTHLHQTVQLGCWP